MGVFYRTSSLLTTISVPSILEVMPDQLNKQAIVNLLIDSPLREPIKINLIDIVNNTTEPDLPKVFPTIAKELEIFQKATERRMKLAEETIAKLGGVTPTAPDMPTPADMPPTPSIPTPPPMPPMPELTTPVTPAPQPGLSVPPLDLPPMPTQPIQSPADMPLPPLPPMPATTIQPESTSTMPVMDTTTPPLPTPEPLGGATVAPQADEDALAEIQKELDSLKTSTAADISSAAAPAPVTPQA